MTPEEAGRLVAVVAVAFPHTSTAVGTVDLWLSVLGDLEADEVQTALHEMLKLDEYTRGRWLQPSSVRRYVLDRRGLLAPSLTQAWGLACAFATATDWRSLSTAEDVARAQIETGVTPPPVPVLAALNAIGGVETLRFDTSTTLFAQFRDAYTAAAREHDRAVILVEQHTPRAITREARA